MYPFTKKNKKNYVVTDSCYVRLFKASSYRPVLSAEVFILNVAMATYSFWRNC